MGNLTDRQCRLAKADDGKDLFLNAGGGLYLRVRPGDGASKVWLFRFKSLVGNGSKWFGIGTYPAISLKDATLKAAELAVKRRSGIDPIEEKREADEAARQAKEAESQAKEAIRNRMTVNDLFLRWHRLELKARKDSGAEILRSFEKDVLPALGNVAVEDVKRSAIAACLDNVVERGAPIIARNLLGDLRQMFGFAIKREFVENDPTSHLKRDDFGKKVERDRVLDDGEVRLLMELLPKAELQEASVASIWIILSTCCRVGEITQARWEHVDLNAATWWVPPDNSKNSKEHKIILSDFAKGHFETLRRLVIDEATKRETDPSPWLLPARQRDGHVCLKSLAKQIGDRQRGDKPAMSNRTKLIQALELPRGKWTPHDLRRTGATMMGTLGVRPDVIEKCLNHVQQNRLVRIYQRQTLLAEQAEAWRLLGDRLQLLTQLSDSKVLIMGRSAA